MPGIQKVHRKREFGRAFPSSRYDDPRGGRPSALERNILRYRAAEATLYLFHAEEVRDFMVANVHPGAIRDPAASPWEPSEERRLERILSNVLTDAETKNKVSIQDAKALRLVFTGERQQGKKLKLAFGHAIKIGMFTKKRAGELDDLARQPGSRGAADGHACERFRKAPDHHVRRYVPSRPGTNMSSQVRRPKAVGDKTERKAIYTPNSS